VEEARKKKKEILAFPGGKLRQNREAEKTVRVPKNGERLNRAERIKEKREGKNLLEENSEGKEEGRQR